MPFYPRPAHALKARNPARLAGLSQTRELRRPQNLGRPSPLCEWPGTPGCWTARMAKFTTPEPRELMRLGGACTKAVNGKPPIVPDCVAFPRCQGRGSTLARAVGFGGLGWDLTSPPPVWCLALFQKRPSDAEPGHVAPGRRTPARGRPASARSSRLGLHPGRGRRRAFEPGRFGARGDSRRRNHASSRTNAVRTPA